MKIYTNEQEPLLYDALIHHEITEEQYQEAIADWDSKCGDRNNMFMLEISEVLGFWPTKVTKIEDDVVSSF